MYPILTILYPTTFILFVLTNIVNDLCLTKSEQLSFPTLISHFSPSSPSPCLTQNLPFTLLLLYPISRIMSQSFLRWKMSNTWHGLNFSKFTHDLIDANTRHGKQKAPPTEEETKLWLTLDATVLQWIYATISHDLSFFCFSFYYILDLNIFLVFDK